MADGNRPVLRCVERATSKVCVLDTSTGRVCSERICAQLEPIRVSPVRPDRQMSFEGAERTRSPGAGLSVMDQPAVVSSSFEHDHRCSPDPPLSSGSASVLQRGLPPSHGNGLSHPIRVEIVRERFVKRGLSDAVVELLLASNRDATSRAYQSAWKSWCHWNVERGSDPLSSNLNAILEYLGNLSRSGKAFNTINIHRSMLSATLDPVEGFPVGRHPMVKQLLKGCFNYQPPAHKYSSMWDSDMVLDFMSRCGSNESLTLGVLSKKLETALALATLLRVSEIASITRESVVFNSSGVVFSLSKPRKAQKSGALQSISLERVDDPLICLVECLGYYVYCTDFLRSDINQNLLLVGLQKPHREVSGSTVGRWVKDFLSMAGVDSNIFSAHSTRGAASSKAAAVGLHIDSILATANWSRSSTFSKYYHRDMFLGRFLIVNWLCSHR